MVAMESDKSFRTLELDAARDASSFRRVFSGRKDSEGAPGDRLMHAWSIDATQGKAEVITQSQRESCPPEVYLG